MQHQPPSVPLDIVDKLRLTCLDLPEAYEERAWQGTRWMVAKRNFAHVLMIASGQPLAYARAAGTVAACVLTFRWPEPTALVPRFARPPFFRPPWFANIAGLRLSAVTDWDEVAELVTQSYRALAPKKLLGLLDSA